MSFRAEKTRSPSDITESYTHTCTGMFHHVSYTETTYTTDFGIHCFDLSVLFKQNTKHVTKTLLHASRKYIHAKTKSKYICRILIMYMHPDMHITKTF